MPSGDNVNLLNGSYVLADGTSTGNIYSTASSDIPNTSTLPMPSQWQGTGVGGAIPATALGGTVAPVTATATAITTFSSTGTVSGSLQTIVSTQTQTQTVVSTSGSASATASATGSASAAMAGKVRLENKSTFGLAFGLLLAMLAL
jgi:hypothetical protein